MKKKEPEQTPAKQTKLPPIICPLKPEEIDLKSLSKFYFANIKLFQEKGFCKSGYCEYPGIEGGSDIRRLYVSTFCDYFFDIIYKFNLSNLEKIDDFLSWAPSDPEDYAKVHLTDFIEYFRKCLWAETGTRDLLTTDIAIRERMVGLTRIIQQMDLPNVVIEGETGVGKELFARHIHKIYSDRKKEASPEAPASPFMAINCAAIPDSLAESIFLGHKKGAFTGAIGAAEGLFEQANGGILFLDEVGRLSLKGQQIILRVIEEKKVRKVGETKEIDVDTHCIFATNTDLRQMVRKGGFLEDLYYRIAEYPITVRPLRERPKDDFYLLVTDFRTEMLEARPPSWHPYVMPPAAIEEMAQTEKHSWRGNVRQLKNVVRRLIQESIAKERLIDKDMAARVIAESEIGEPEQSSRGLKDDRAAAERKAINDALAKSGGNKREAAKIIGLSESWLYLKLKKYQIS